MAMPSDGGSDIPHMDRPHTNTLSAELDLLHLQHNPGVRSREVTQELLESLIQLTSASPGISILCLKLLQEKQEAVTKLVISPPSPLTHPGSHTQNKRERTENLEDENEIHLCFLGYFFCSA